MNFRTFSIGLLLLGLLLPGAVTAALPATFDSRILIPPGRLSGFGTNNLTAIGAGYDQGLSTGETMTCTEVRGRTLCYYYHRNPAGPGAPVSMVSQSDVPDNMLALLTALRGAGNSPS